MNLYAQYLKERENKELIEKEFGFCIYEMAKPFMYIADVFVSKENRKKGHAADFVEEIKQIAKEAGCKHIITGFCLKANNWKISKRVIQKLGFEFFRKDKTNKIIYTIMEI